MKINKTSSALRRAVAFGEGGFTLIELLVTIAIIAILASVVLPVFASVQERGKQTKDMSNGKQIALGLKQFATDREGVFPNKIPGADYALAADLTGANKSNDAFWWLFPTYLTSEDIFVVGGSAWSPNPPNNILDAAGSPARVNTLAAGECGYLYVAALNDTANPQFPLLADAGTTADVTTYTNVQTDRGGLWKGKRAAIIFVDGSGRVMTVDDQTVTTASFVKRTAHTYNMFSLAGGTPTDPWLSAANLMLPPQ